MPIEVCRDGVVPGFAMHEERGREVGLGKNGPRAGRAALAARAVSSAGRHGSFMSGVVRHRRRRPFCALLPSQASELRTGDVMRSRLLPHALCALARFGGLEHMAPTRGSVETWQDE